MDLLFFYVGFELALLPLLVLISRWGSEDSGAAGKRFVLVYARGQHSDGISVDRHHAKVRWTFGTERIV